MFKTIIGTLSAFMFVGCILALSNMIIFVIVVAYGEYGWAVFSSISIVASVWLTIDAKREIIIMKDKFKSLGMSEED